MGEPPGRLTGKVCVIAGAGGEIAEAVAARLASEDATVVGIDRELLVTSFECLSADLTDEKQSRRVFEALAATYGRIHVLYNNAGPIDRDDHSPLTTSTETWERVFRANLTPTVMACKYGIPLMGEGRAAHGSVINTGSFLAGMGAATAQMAFSTAKAAVNQLTRDLGTHLARTGIRVNALALGPVATRQIERVFAALGAEGATRRMAHIPMGRFADLDDVAAAVAFLASDDSRYITASEFPIHGGIPGAYTLPE